MKQFVILLIIILKFCLCFGQLTNQICYIVPSTNSGKAIRQSGPYAPYGNSLTPLGDLKILVISAGFGLPYDNYSVGNWATGTTSLPTWFSDKSIFYNSTADFVSYSYLNNNSNVSRFYYEMSNQKFRFIADYYPSRINIDASGANGWSELNRRVMEKFKVQNPNFNWSTYDKRTNLPSFQSDNSISTPDLQPDFIVIVYRYTGGWSASTTTSQPVSNMHTWPGSGGGFSALSLSNAVTQNGYNIDPGSGFTFCAGDVNPTQLFIHEMAHSIFDCPHYTDVNGVAGDYFCAQASGWGMMRLDSGPFASANGWERWYLGWSSSTTSIINSQSDIPPLSNGEFVLRDFITTGDALKIKIPNGTGKDQYLWLENHQGLSVFDNRLWINDGCGGAFPNSPRGLVAYIESINGTQTVNVSGLLSSSGAANGIKYINPKGRFDYTLGSSNVPCNLWGNIIYNVLEGNPNPISGQSRAEDIRADINNDNQIYYHKDPNNAPYGYPKNEWHWINKRNDIFTYDAFGGNLVFEIGQKLGIGTNPALVNRPMYLGISNFDISSPIILNGISVTVVDRNINGHIKIRLKYNEVSLDSNLRWTGSINLPDITGNANPDLILKSNRVLSFDKSGTPDRKNPLPGTFTNSFEKFINPTTFTGLNSAYIVQEPNSQIIVKKSSNFILKTGSSLEIQDGASITIKAGSKFIVEAGATLTLSGTARIEIECNAIFNVQSGASFKLLNTTTSINIHTGAILSGLTTLSSVVNGTGIINYPSAFSANSLTIQNVNYTIDNITSAKSITAQPNVIVTSPSKVIYTTEGDVILGNSFEVKQGAYFRTDISKNSCVD